MKEIIRKIVGRIYRITYWTIRIVLINPVIYFPNLIRENQSKNSLKKQNLELYRITEKIFDKIQKRKLKFRGWSLAKSSIRYAVLEVFSTKNENINIVELGGGVSTFFWHYLKKEVSNINLEITTFEHDKDWSEYLQKEVGENITILHCGLKQSTENERENLFENPEEALSSWLRINTFLDEKKFKTTRIRNVFYDIPLAFLESNEKIDLLIVDGPHGNGRSMSFPLFQKKIEKDTIILLDDFNHYPFVDDLKKLFNVEIKNCENSYSKKWILLKVIK